MNNIDTPLLFKMAGYPDLDDGISHRGGQVCAPNDPYWASQHNTSRFNELNTVPICFYSGAPEYSAEKGNCSYAAVVKYSWWADTISTPGSRALWALAESDPRLKNVTECELENELPEMATHPPILLRPVSGGIMTGPELRGQRQPSNGDEEHTSMPDSPEIRSSSPYPLHIPVNMPSMGSRADGKGTPGGAGAQPNGNSHVTPSSIGLPTVAIGSQKVQPVFVGGSQPVVVIGNNTIPLNGPAVTIDGALVSFRPQELIVNTQTIPLVPEIPIILGTEQARVVKGFGNQNLIIFGSSTITAAGLEYTAAGHVVQFATDSVVVDGTSTYHFPTALPTAPVAVDGAIKGQRAETSITTDRTLNPTTLAVSSAQITAKPNLKSKKNMAVRGCEMSLRWRVLVMIIGVSLVILM
jgi:hypothetical protein